MRSSLLILLFLVAAHLCSAQSDEHIQKKLSPTLLHIKKNVDRNLEQVFWISSTGNEQTKNVLQRKNASVKILAEFPGTNLLVIQSSWRIIDSILLPTPFVRFIDMPRIPKEELALSDFDNSVNGVNLLHNRFPFINGNNLMVSIKENRFDATDIDFRGRYISTPMESAQVSSHATIMATLAAGGGNSFYTGKGAAWGATLSSSDFASLLPDSQAGYENISVQNHSYGTGIENFYGADAAAYDATVINKPSLVHIFSSGNSGNETSTSGNYNGIAGIANLTGSFKMAKNIITVGAVDSFFKVATLSSKGPAYDGRIKPELVAYGQEGSSGAAAITSGIALMIQQAYKDLHGGTLPAAALVKAALINTADDLGNRGPDYISGYGNVNAFKAVNAVLQDQFFSGSSSAGATNQFDLSIPAGLRKLSITLCWSDPPAAANATPALINDLDLSIQQLNTGKSWQPWVLSTFPHKDSLLLPARHARDSLNNVEQITVENPEAGNYRIMVNGYAVPSGPQPFFIAYHADTADWFTWNFPASTDHLLSNENNLLRWSSTYDEATTGLLEYSIDKGNTWSLIADAVNLRAGYTNWSAPDTFCTVLFSMKTGGDIYISDTAIISKPFNLRVGFNCPDSVLLYWNAEKGINNYRVWSLGTKYLESFATVTDTFMIFPRSGNLSFHYSVSPSIGGVKAPTIDFRQQGVECYITNFLADQINNQAVQLSIELGTLYQVKEVVFEKLNGNSFSVLQTISSNGILQYNFTDNNLIKGANTYRAVIVLQSGRKIYSQAATIFNFGISPYLIFPNPASPNTLLQVHSPDLQPRQLILYDSRGQKVLEKRIVELVSKVSLASLAKGVYFIMILKAGKKDYSGNLLVN